MNFQAEVRTWMLQVFNKEIAANRIERNWRFLEESLELVQACGGTQGNALKMVEYVFDRPCGKPSIEVGDVMITLAALCNAREIDLNYVAAKGLARGYKNIDKIRAKHNSKALSDSPYPSGEAEEKQA